MPELPEVQTVVDELNVANLPGRRIADGAVYWPKTVATGDPRGFCRTLRGRRIGSIGRRGKYIVIELAGPFLLIHLRMTGKLYLKKPYERRTSHEHLVLKLDDGRRLAFNDTRKFGRFYLVADKATVLGKLGPEPLDRRFRARTLGELLKGRRRRIKPLLLDQTMIAGLGNIYVDEALWSARLHPLRRSASLGWDEVRRLHRSIRSVLRQGLRNSGTTLGWGKTNFISPSWAKGRNRTALKVFRRTGEACPRCGAPIRRISVAQRSSHFCGNCQRAPKDAESQSEPGKP